MDTTSMQGQGMKCACPHHKVAPFLVILFGLLFLLEALGVWDMAIVNVVWPILVIIMGFIKVGEGKCKCC